VPIPVLGLILTAAVVHATWNLLAKQAPGGVAFVWLVSATATVAWLPVAVVAVAVDGFHLGVLGWGLVLGSSILQVGYLLALQAGYRHGDLSVNYPLARGTAPLVSTLGAVIVLGERPGPLGILGLVLLAGGVVALSSGGWFNGARPGVNTGAAIGLGVGLIIAMYTVWDAYAVKVAGLSPFLYLWLNEAGRGLLVTPAVLRGDGVSTVRTVWREHRFKILGVGVLAPFAYLLVLLALRTSDVSRVAPLRESSVLIGVLFGAHFLKEGDLRRRLVAAAAIVAGIVVLAW
jgi:drug/metabolite transporter (DMT)-like permease